MRPVRKIVILWIQLFLWSLICVFRLDGSLWKDLDKAITAVRETPLPAFIVFFGLLMIAVARYLKVSGQDAASIFGAGGLEHGFSHPQTVGWVWLTLAMTATAIGLGIAESVRRYYFVQDDNFAEFLPGIIYGCRELFAGRFANWDPYQLMGMPLADLGIYALTYPGTYLSYGIAKYLLGDELRVIDVFCWLHLVLASGVVYLVGRQLRLWGPIAAAVAVCFALSGYDLIAGRSWYYMTANALWFPALLLLGLRFDPNRLRWSWTATVGLCMGLFFHAGNAQMCFYSVSSLLLLVLLRKVKEEWHWQSLAYVLPGLLIGVGLSLPLMIPQLKVTAGLLREPIGEGIERGLFSLLLPNPFVNSLMFNKLGTDPSAPGGEFYFAGGLFVFAWFLGIAAICVGRDGLKAFRANPLLTLSVVAFLLALGRNGGLWVIHTQLPILSRFSQPSKFLAFAQLFMLLIGALFVQRICSGLKHRRAAAGGVFALLVALMFHHASLSTEAFYTYGDRPDFKISQGLLQSIGQERVFSAAPSKGGQPGFLSNLLCNTGTLAQVNSMDGYESLWRLKHPYVGLQNAFVDDQLGTLKKYGVTRLLINDAVKHPVLSNNKENHSAEQLPAEWIEKLSRLSRQQPPLFIGGMASVFGIEGSDPLARRERDLAPLPVQISQGDIVVGGLSQAGDDIMVNYLWRPGIAAYAGGQRVETRPDPFSRVLLTLPIAAKEVRVRYEVDWGTAISFGLASVLAGCALGWRMAWSNAAGGALHS